MDILVGFMIGLSCGLFLWLQEKSLSKQIELWREEDRETLKYWRELYKNKLTEKQ